jgi:hypothetical protein
VIYIYELDEVTPLIDESMRSYEDLQLDVAKKDANATYGPRWAIYLSGFLANFVILWIPMVIYLVVFVFQYFFGDAFDKETIAVNNLLNGWSNYISSVGWFTLILGVVGIGLAYLRGYSCRNDWYFRWELKQGEYRMGLNEVVMAFGVPVLAIIWLFTYGDPNSFFVALVPIIFSGVLLNAVYRRFHDKFLRLFYRPSFIDGMVMGLKVYLPRRIGQEHVLIDKLVINEDRSVDVYGYFDSEETKREVKSVTSHFLRGYDPVHTIDIDDQEQIEA